MEPIYIIGKNISAATFPKDFFKDKTTIGLNHAATIFNTTYGFTGHTWEVKNYDLAGYPLEKRIYTNPLFEKTIAEGGFSYINQRENPSIDRLELQPDDVIIENIEDALSGAVECDFDNFWTILHLAIFWCIQRGHRDIRLIGCNNTYGSIHKDDMRHHHFVRYHTDRIIELSAERGVNITKYRDYTHYRLMEGETFGKKGIVLFVFGHESYGGWAANLALSIKTHSSDLPIHVVCEAPTLKRLQKHHLELFSSISYIDGADLYDEGGKMNPGKLKTSAYKYLPFEENIILDIDALCLKPLEPLFDECSGKNIVSQVTGTADHTCDKWQCGWMKLEDVREHFTLPEKYKLFEINSSFFYVKKSDEAEKLYQQARENIIVDKKKVRLWGGTIPDELAFNVAFGQTGINPMFEGQDESKLSYSNGYPVVFPHKFVSSPSKLADTHYLLGLYGPAGYVRPFASEYYDRVIHKASKERFGRNIEFKAHQLLKYKHAGKK